MSPAAYEAEESDWDAWKAKNGPTTPVGGGVTPAVTAKATYVDDVDGSEIIELSTGHRIQAGGMGDGYCYGHQSFDCLEHLSDEELVAYGDAEPGPLP